VTCCSPAWILATASSSEPGSFSGRDPVRPQACLTCADDVYRQAGITRPREQIDMAELYVPFSWHEPIWLEAHHLAEVGEGWKMVDSGANEIGGSFPSTARAACYPPTRSARRACCGSLKPRTRCASGRRPSS
jgi:acetyl-CoA acetyltransferase